MTDSALRRTPLHALHVELGAKLVPFAGWDMPVQYPGGIIAEHMACRSDAALFDVSHMAQVSIRGDNAADALEGLCPGGLTTLKPGQARYTQFTTPDGGIFDDLIVTNAGDHLFLVVNAAMRDQDLDILRSGLPDHVVTEITDRALIALQGPKAAAVLSGLIPAVGDLKFMQSTLADWDGADLRVSRLGYTGEDGFEISVSEDRAEGFARALLADDAVTPAGLGARDTLRMEAGLPLYGQDIDQTTSPVEAGLGFSIPKRRREPGGFPGADSIIAQATDGPARKLVGIAPQGRAPARAGTVITDASGAEIGKVTSGGFSPSLERPISLGYVAAECSDPDTGVTLLIRGKPQPATITALPFVPHRYHR